MEPQVKSVLDSLSNVINGRPPVSLPEVTVYGKRKYVEELDKLSALQEKYMADMQKYKKDSTQWVTANKAYQDSLEHYNIAKPVYDKGYYDVEAYNKASDYYRNKYGSYGKFWGDENNRPGIKLLKAVKREGQDKIIRNDETEYGWGVPIYTKPKVTPAAPTPPGSPPADVKYDPKFESLNMKSLWPDILKRDPDAIIGTLSPLDPGYSKKGFTLAEAMEFPKEIRDKYKIDYIAEQLKKQGSLNKAKIQRRK
jgi:hypothetical protein